MAVWYVDDEGSNANDGTTSGNPKKYLWLDDGDSALFNEALDADRPAAGDTVFVLALHDENHSTTAVVLTDNGKGTLIAPIKVVTVDSLSTPTAYGSKGNSTIRHAGAAAGDHITFNGHFFFQGIQFSAGDDLTVIGNTREYTFQDCILESLRDETVSLTAKYVTTTLKNTDAGGVTDAPVIVSQVCNFRWEGGACLGADGMSIGSEVGLVDVRGVDFTACTDSIIASMHPENGIVIHLSRCKVPVSPTWLVGAIPEESIIIIDHCSSTNAYYQYLEISFRGEISFDDSNARTATYDGTNKYSTLMTSNANVSGDLSTSLKTKLVELQGIDLTSETTLTIQLSQWNDGGGAPDALTEHEFWVEVESVDDTDLALGQWHRSPSDTGFWDASPDDLTSSDEVWTQTSDITEQEVEIVLPAVTGADNVSLAVWVHLSKPNAAVNVCPEVDIT